MESVSLIIAIHAISDQKPLAWKRGEDGDTTPLVFDTSDPTVISLTLGLYNCVTPSRHCSSLLYICDII